jgi:hypothetical protein
MADFKVLTTTKLATIGRKQGLSGSNLNRYVGFFKARFPQEWNVEYATEWAHRFKGNPYAYADIHSTKILTRMKR